MIIELLSSHLTHIVKNKRILNYVRTSSASFANGFGRKDFWKLRRRLFYACRTGTVLSPMKIAIHDERGKYQGYLHTSPEYTMKKMLAAGFTKIFPFVKHFATAKVLAARTIQVTMINGTARRRIFAGMVDCDNTVFIDDGLTKKIFPMPISRFSIDASICGTPGQKICRGESR